MSDSSPTLAEIDRKIDRIGANIEKALDDHETRLRNLERWAYMIPPTLITGVAAVFAAMFT